MITRKFLLIFFIVSNNFLFPQIIVESSNTFKRVGDLLKNNSAVFPATSTGFMSSFSANFTDEWTSPSSRIFINSLPFNCLPFNYNSLDLIPIDLLQIDKLEAATTTSILYGNSVYSGLLNIKPKKINDSLSIQFRAFTGSETGDPLIYRFTRSDVVIGNKNKIVPSGVISIENRSGDFAYRLTGGYFGYFTFNSSGIGTVIAQLSPALLLKQNKQFLTSAEFEYKISKKKRLDVFSSFISYYGWEIPPFITTPIHFESYLYTIRGALKNLFENVSVNFRKDGSYNKVKNLELIPAAGFILDEMAVSPLWNITSSSKLKIDLFSEASLISAHEFEVSNVNHQQKFFNQDQNKFNFYISPSVGFSLFRNMQFITSVKYDHHFVNKTFSGELSGNWKIDESNDIKISAASVARFPNLTELYGEFGIVRDVNSSRETFVISGNQFLKEERNNSLVFSYSFDYDKIYCLTDFYYRIVENPIYQNNLEIVESDFPGDIVRNAVYINFKNQNYFGINFTSKISFTNSISAEASYSYIDNKSKLYTPKNRAVVSFSYIFPFNGKLSGGLFYSDEKIFEDFILTSQNQKKENYYLSSITSFNLSYHQNIDQLYFLRNLEFRIKIENLFNNRVRHFPFGNYLDRTIEFFISFMI